MRIAIVGGGLAGCAAAYVLKRAGADVAIYEASDRLASAASGNVVGLYNPRFGAEASPQTEFYARAYQHALEVIGGVEEVNQHALGSLHLITDEKKERRFFKTYKTWKGYGFTDADMRLVDADEASRIAGVGVDQGALYLPRGGSVSPAALCAVYAHGVEVHYNVSAIPQGDVVILAGGAGMIGHPLLAPLDLRSVRGQVSYIAANAQTRRLKTHVIYGGYVSPEVDGRHVVGASFQRLLSHCDISPADDADNLAKLRDALPDMDAEFDIVDHRAGVRCSARDYFPVVGHMGGGIYVSLAHGSHGIVSSILAAEILVAEILGLPQKVSDECVAALSPARLMR
ncbi:MAG: FAD-dependent oxidoreductase [Alphaproteobacteria bacterium]